MWTQQEAGKVNDKRGNTQINQFLAEAADYKLQLEQQ
jgi:hypothetical protein